jgi:hypothetical protein
MVLACTIHNPREDFALLLEKLFSAVQEGFDEIVVTSSPNLHVDIKMFLQKHKYSTSIFELSENNIGAYYRNALKMGSELGDVFYWRY